MKKLRFLLMLQMAANAALALGPFESAVEKLSAKTPIGSILKTVEWSLLPLELRESAFFSATIESGKFLEEAQSRILAAVAHARDGSGGLVDRSVFVAELRKLGTELGLRAKDPDLVGTLQDPLSTRRLQLIFDIQTARAAGHAEWKMGNDADMLDAFPAQELVRKEGRKAPREWHKRWTEAGAELVQGRMVALKTDAVWTRISRFGTPWPPFDFQSGMGLIELDRSEAEELGLITEDEMLEPAELPFTEAMQADVSQMSPRFTAGLKAIFGEQVNIADGKAVWVGQSGSSVMANSSHQARWGKGSAKGGQFAPYPSYDENLKSGNEAVDRALRTKRDVTGAMRVKGIGTIDFPWGTPGDASRDFAGGHGLSHMAGKHGEADARLLPKMILDATSKLRRQETFIPKDEPIHGSSDRRYIAKRKADAERQTRIELRGSVGGKEYTLSLIQKKSRSTAWLLTGYTRKVQK